MQPFNHPSWHANYNEWDLAQHKAINTEIMNFLVDNVIYMVGDVYLTGSQLWTRVLRIPKDVYTPGDIDIICSNGNALDMQLAMLVKYGWKVDTVGKMGAIKLLNSAGAKIDLFTPPYPYSVAATVSQFPHPWQRVYWSPFTGIVSMFKLPELSTFKFRDYNGT